MLLPSSYTRSNNRGTFQRLLFARQRSFSPSPRDGVTYSRAVPSFLLNLSDYPLAEYNKKFCLTEAQIYAFLDFICEMPMDDVNKRRALINIFVQSVYLYDDHFTIIINASKKPLSIENIPLDEIEEAFEGENEGKEGCSSMTTPAPPKIQSTPCGCSVFLN